MDNLAERNDFIKLFEDLYDAVYMYPIEKTEVKELPVVVNKPTILDKLLKKDDKTEVLPVIKLTTDGHLEKINSAYINLKEYLDNILSKESQDFWILWRMCQFVRWAEKIGLYDNDPDSSLIFVDSEMNANEREFKFKTNGTTFFFKLQLISRPELSTFSSFEKSSYIEAITILVEREYGKKMKTKIVSVDKDVELIDDSDIYLINQINRLINDEIRLFFYKVLDRVLGKYDNIAFEVPISHGFYLNKKG